MFAVCSWTDRIRVPPAYFGGPAEMSDSGGGVSSSVIDYLSRELDATYSNRVIPGVGLAMSLWSVDSVKETLILPGDGGILPNGA